MLRSDAATRCGTPNQCARDPLYREVSRTLIHAFVASNRPLEAKAAWLALGATHAGRDKTSSQIWAAQMAYRKIHPDMKAPVPVTEEGADETAAIDTTTIDLVRGEVASIASIGHGVSKVTFKDPVATKLCNETKPRSRVSTGPSSRRSSSTRRHAPTPSPAKQVTVQRRGSGGRPNIKPGMTVVVAASGTADARKGEVVRVASNGKVIQMGPDKFLQASGDPLKGQP